MSVFAVSYLLKYGWLPSSDDFSAPILNGWEQLAAEHLCLALCSVNEYGSKPEIYIRTRLQYAIFPCAC